MKVARQVLGCTLIASPIIGFAVVLFRIMPVSDFVLVFGLTGLCVAVIGAGAYLVGWK